VQHKLSVLGLALYGSQAASHRVRLSQYKKPLSSLGVNLEIQSFHNNKYIIDRYAGNSFSALDLISAYIMRIILILFSRHDLLIVHCELLPFCPSWLEICLLRKKKYIYDFDDAFYLKYRTGKLKFLAPFLGSKFEYFIKSASAVCAGSKVLSDYALDFNKNVFVLPSVVDTRRIMPKDDQSKIVVNTHFVIGWVGTPSTAKYLQLIIEPLQMLAAELPVKLIVVGAKILPIKGLQVFHEEWRLDSERDTMCNFDVGVMPLPDTGWARGKCAYKLIQYMACGIPVVASPVGVNADIISRDCGFLATTTSEWFQALYRLAFDSPLRKQMGLSARQLIEQNFSLDKAACLLATIIKQAHPCECND